MTQIKHVDPAPGLEGLEPLVGKWHLEGELRDGPFGPAAPFAAVSTYEWLEGGHFLIHRLEGRFGSRAAACLEVLGREAAQVVSSSYYGDGNRRSGTLLVRGDALEWTSRAEGEPDVRCELRVVEEGNTLEAKWTQQQPDGKWSVFLETRGTKAQPLPNVSVGP